MLEAGPEPGGAVRSGALTVPGFTHDLFSAFYPLAIASPAIRNLHLEQHGLRWCRSPIVLAHPLADGRCATLSMDIGATAANLDTFATADGQSWTTMIEEWDRVADPLLDAFLGPFPPLRQIARLSARTGPKGLLRLARHLLLSVRRLQEERFTVRPEPTQLAPPRPAASGEPDTCSSGLSRTGTEAPNSATRPD
jgi:phytoene dehydrogenase-like protein